MSDTVVQLEAVRAQRNNGFAVDSLEFVADMVAGDVDFLSNEIRGRQRFLSPKQYRRSIMALMLISKARDLLRQLT